MEDGDGVEYQSILDVEVSLRDFAVVVTAGTLCYAGVVLAAAVHAALHAAAALLWSWLAGALVLAAVVTVSAWC